MMPIIRIGILGAARVAPYALIDPARRIPEVAIEAVASRSPARAHSFAARHAIPKVFDSYAALVDSDEIDAVYVALPPALHGVWTLRALQRGKHVLCEKPLATHALLAGEMAAAARRCGRVLQEGVHTIHAPALRRQREILQSGALGRIRHVASTTRHPAIPMLPDDFRLRLEMGGGAALDVGCYAVAALRFVAGEEPEVRDATCECCAPDVDGWMQARLALPSGATGLVECGFRGAFEPKFGVEVECERGWITVGPGGLAYSRDGQVVREPAGAGPTYHLQLEAFVRQVRGQSSDAISPEDSVAIAHVVDAMYDKAGLAPRGALAPS